MKILIKNGRLLDPSRMRDETADVFIVDGVIAETGKDIICSADEIIDADGMWVVPGLIDMHVHLRDPGYEYKETIHTGTMSAAMGGFTTVCCMPNTLPINDCAQITDYIKQKAAQEGIVNVLPVGSITKGQNGTKLADLPEMVKAGICGISEDGKTVRNAALMKQALEKAAIYGIPVLAHCEDTDLEAEAGESEEVIVSRDITLSAGTGAKLHICHVSAHGSIAQLRLAAAMGRKVTAEAAPHHFILSGLDNINKDPNFKMNPPLRSREDVLAIREAIRDNIIQVIATDHAPHSEEEKSSTYEKAANGIIGLETAVGLSIACLYHGGYLTPLELISKMTYNPAKILGIDRGTLAEGKPADVTIIDPEIEYKIDINKFASKSKNSPFNNYLAKGKPVYTIVNGKIVMKRGKLI